MRLQYSDLVVPQATPVGSSQGRAPVQPVPVGNFGETPETAITQGIVNFGQNVLPVLERMREKKEQLDRMTLNADKALQRQKAANALDKYLISTVDTINDEKQLRESYSDLYVNGKTPTTTEIYDKVNGGVTSQIETIVSNHTVAKDGFVDESFSDLLRETLISQSLKPMAEIQSGLFKKQTAEHVEVLDNYKEVTQNVISDPKVPASFKEARIGYYIKRLDDAIEAGTFSPMYALHQFSSAINFSIYSEAARDLTEKGPEFFMQKLKASGYSRIVDLQKSKMLSAAKEIHGTNATGYPASLDPTQVNNLLSIAIPSIKSNQSIEQNKKEELIQDAQRIKLFQSMTTNPLAAKNKINSELGHRRDYDSEEGYIRSGGEFDHVPTEVLISTLKTIENNTGLVEELTPDERRILNDIIPRIYNDAFKTGFSASTYIADKRYQDIFKKKGDRDVIKFFEQFGFIASLGIAQKKVRGLTEYSTVANGATIHTPAQIEKIKAEFEKEFSYLAPDMSSEAEAYKNAFFKMLDDFSSKPVAERAALIIQDPNNYNENLPPELQYPANKNPVIGYINTQHHLLGNPPVEDLVDLQKLGIQALTPGQIEEFKGFEIRTVADLQRFFARLYEISGHQFDRNAPFDIRDVPNDVKEIAVLAANDLLKNNALPLSPIKANILLTPPITASGVIDPSQNAKYIIEAGDPTASTTALTRAPTIKGLIYDILQENGISFIPGQEDSQSQKENLHLILYVAARLRAEELGLSSSDIDIWEEDAKKASGGGLIESYFGEDPAPYIQKAIDYTYNSRYVPIKETSTGETHLIPKAELTRAHGQFPADPQEARQVVNDGLQALRIIVSSALMQTNQFENAYKKDYISTVKRTMTEEAFSKIERSVAELALNLSRKIGQDVVLNKDDYQIDFIQNSTGTGIYPVVYLKDPHNFGFANLQFIVKDPDNPSKNLEFEYRTLSDLAYMGDRYSAINNAGNIVEGVVRSDRLMDAVSSIAYGKPEDNIFSRVYSAITSDDEVNYIVALEKFLETNGFEPFGARPGDIRWLRREFFPGSNEVPFVSSDPNEIEEHARKLIESAETGKPYENYLSVAPSTDAANRAMDFTPNAFYGRNARQAIGELKEFMISRMGSREAAENMTKKQFEKLVKEFLVDNVLIKDNVFIRLRALAGNIGIPSSTRSSLKKKDKSVMDDLQQ
jgi:hypothetical protein